MRRKSNVRIKSSRAEQTINAHPLFSVAGHVPDMKYLIFVSCASFLVSACNLASSQPVNSNNQNANPRIIAETRKNENAPIDDDYEASKSGAEALNNEPLPLSNLKGKDKLLSRDQIRAALIRHKLIGESAKGEIGGYKVVHFSHVCNLDVGNQSFYVVEMKGIQQLASFARGDSRTLIFDESFNLLHNLNAPEPFFCEGNRLFFNDYKMTTFYGEPEKQVKGNVLIFSNNAKEIEGRMANLNFYKFKDLIR